MILDATDMAEYYLSVLDHYQLLSKNFEGVRGYEMYRKKVMSSLELFGKEVIPELRRW
jgi:hypothetical protein